MNISNIPAEYGLFEPTAVFVPFKYEILVVAEGIFNMATLSGGTEIAITGVGRGDPASNWSNSNVSKIEVLFSYQQ